MASPWAKIEKVEPLNLSEIMSEEIAKDLQDKEDKKCQTLFDIGKEDIAGAPAPEYTIPEDVLKALSNDPVETDALIAQLLQQQFDMEYNEDLKRQEKKLNGESKVSVTFNNFKRSQYDFDSNSDEEEIEDICDRKDWDRFDMLERDINSIPASGYKVQKNGEVITKHDLVNSGRKNACRLLSFPPEFQTGDGESFDLKLSNKVFNSLKTYSNKEQSRRYKTHDKKDELATTTFGIDEYTDNILFKMFQSELLDQVNGVISIGKEAVIIHANANPNHPNAQNLKSDEFAIKVFKTTLSEFKQRDKYIKDDHRFKDKVGKQNSKKIIRIWAEKEMANLMRLKRAGINCPEVVALKKHVLVMSFIGVGHRAAPKLKDVVLSDADYIMAYEQVIEGMKSLYEKANLIHADLSEYNILWHNQECYFIDVSQSVEPSHENAFHFLYRDCCNVINFFSKKGVSKILTPEELFRDIVGCLFTDKVALLAVQESFKMKPHLVDKPGVESTFIFENAWEKAQNEKLERASVGSQDTLPTMDNLVISSVDQLVDPPRA